MEAVCSRWQVLPYPARDASAQEAPTHPPFNTLRAEMHLAQHRAERVRETVLRLEALQPSLLEMGCAAAMLDIALGEGDARGAEREARRLARFAEAISPASPAALHFLAIASGEVSYGTACARYAAFEADLRRDPVNGFEVVRVA